MRTLSTRCIEKARDPRAAGITMTVAAVAALVWANVGGNAYRDLWQHHLSVAGLHFTLQDWINQALMVPFFLIVGLELRRELADGVLQSSRHATVPVGAALAGMAVPAAIYAAVLHGRAGAHGWGVPMATDVAFAVGALALVSASQSRQLRGFLLSLAVADDLASIVVLVVWYSGGIDGVALLVAGVAVALVLALALGRQHRALIALPAVVAWWALARAGVEAAVVGVVIGLVAMAPGRGRASRDWEHSLAPWINAFVLPAFALANVGVTFAGSHLLARDAVWVFVAVFAARVAGKPVGIALSARWLGRTPRSDDDPRPPTRALLGVGSVAAVGFTVPLLIVRAAFSEGSLAAAATCALLAGSVVGALGGRLLLSRAAER